MRLSGVFIAFVILATGFADTLTLKDGKVVTGTYLGGTARQIKMEVADGIQTFEVDRVASLQFQGSASAATQPALSQPTRLDSLPASSSDAGPGVELAAGTNITIRMIDAVDSETNRVGQTFRANIDEPVVVGSQVVIPRGADAVVKLVDSKESGKIAGRTELGLDLMSVRVGGKMVDISTQEVTKASGSRGARSAKVVGGTTALGAIIGGIAGGGRGAAIGAGSGAAVGTGAEVMTKGQRVRIPSETRLTFTTAYPVRI